jgi:hypothetical protein
LDLSFDVPHNHHTAFVEEIALPPKLYRPLGSFIKNQGIDLSANQEKGFSLRTLNADRAFPIACRFSCASVAGASFQRASLIPVLACSIQRRPVSVAGSLSGSAAQMQFVVITGSEALKARGKALDPPAPSHLVEICATKLS